MNEETIVREKWKEINEKYDKFAEREDAKIDELADYCKKKFNDNLNSLSPKARKKIDYRDKLIEKYNKKHKALLIFCVIASFFLAISILPIIAEYTDSIPFIIDITLPITLPLVVLILGLIIKAIKKSIRKSKIVSIYNEPEIYDYMQRKEAIEEEYKNGIENLKVARHEEEIALKEEYWKLKEQMKLYTYKNFLFLHFDMASRHSYEVYIDGVLYESSKRPYLKIKLNRGIHSFKLKAIYEFMDDVRITSFPTTQVDTEDCPEFYTCRCDVFDKNALQKHISLDDFERLIGDELDV